MMIENLWLIWKFLKNSPLTKYWINKLTKYFKIIVNNFKILITSLWERKVPILKDFNGKNMSGTKAVIWILIYKGFIKLAIVLIWYIYCYFFGQLHLSQYLFSWQILNFLKISIIGLSIILTAAGFVLLERKILGAIQNRRGPEVIDEKIKKSPTGFLQPIADAVKLLSKELILPKQTTYMFVLFPFFFFFFSLLNWSFYPWPNFVLLNNNFGIFYIFVISTINSVLILYMGWSSQNSYAYLGALRTLAQMISYDIFLTISIVPIVLSTQSLNLCNIAEWQLNTSMCNFVIYPFFFFIFVISILAEANRAPFDLPEGEGEIIAGYNIEHSSLLFILIFLSEYTNMLFLSALTVLFFFNTIQWWIIKLGMTLFFCFSFIWVRGTLPRFRYDQILDFAWKKLMPLTFGLLIFSTFFFFLLFN